MPLENMSSGRDSAFEKQHLWMYLQALGLDPNSSIRIGGKMMPHVHLGENMFDKLNRDAFHIVSYFLFKTLDKSLAKEVFRLNVGVVFLKLLAHCLCLLVVLSLFI